jgi:hypothetical protein
MNIVTWIILGWRPTGGQPREAHIWPWPPRSASFHLLPELSS